MTALLLIQRRACLALAAAPLLASTGAHAQIANVTGAELQAMKLRSEGVTIDFPPLADTGFSVPLYAELVAPAGKKIESIEVFLPANPNTRAVKLRLMEPQASYAFTTRLRLAGSQDAWVVATLTDGSRIGASAPTVITSSACFDGS
ncbi:MAG: thiosulfate oxidation carrier protein SoxY [Ramlibacter sp.]